MAIDRAHLASRLRISMSERGLSHAELACQSGVDAARLDEIVHGEREANAREIGVLAQVLELDFDDLLGLSVGAHGQLPRQLVFGLFVTSVIETSSAAIDDDLLL